jgi:hypothetical protein
MFWKYYILMDVNGKMRPVKLIHEWGRGIKKNDGGGEFDYDML